MNKRRLEEWGRNPATQLSRRRNQNRMMHFTVKLFDTSNQNWSHLTLKSMNHRCLLPYQMLAAAIYRHVYLQFLHFEGSHQCQNGHQSLSMNHILQCDHGHMLYTVTIRTDQSSYQLPAVMKKHLLNKIISKDKLRG